MDFFVEKHSIVREIWGKSDTILFIFAGASAEFALNKAVDWLYFTGRLPADPIGRLFSTVSYARKIVFSDKEAALNAINNITAIHKNIEIARGSNIPDWAYRDVLFMLIYYSIAAFELLERKLTDQQKEDVYNVFYRMGRQMGIKELPQTYFEWLPVRAAHLEQDLANGHYSADLYKQYKKHLGFFRYYLLKESQSMVVPGRVKELLHLRKQSVLKIAIPVYKVARWIKLDELLKSAILPRKYKSQIKSLNVVTD
jgi:hypothetical protein